MVEVSMYEAHATEYKLELERKNKELEEVRKEYLLQVCIVFAKFDISFCFICI